MCPMYEDAPEPAPIGEVIAASTTQFTAQCLEVSGGDAPELPDPPPFGAFVRVGRRAAVAETAAPLPDDFDPFETPGAPRRATAALEETAAPAAIYGVVFHAETGALEPGRPLTAFGLDEDALRREQPQIYELLATRFTAALVAYAPDAEGQAIRPHLPPRPPRPHARVWMASDAEIRHLTERLDYLRPLLLGGAAVPPGVADEAVAALLRAACRAHGGAGGDGDAFLLRAGRELAALLPADYDRLRAIVNRVAG